MSYWRVFRRPICLTYRYLVFYVEREAFGGRNESFPTSFPEVSTKRLLFPRLRRKLLFSGFLSFVVKYSLHIRVIMSAVCVLADRTYSSSNTFSITTGRGSWNARFNFSSVQLERQQTKNNQVQVNERLLHLPREREARECDFLITCDAIARLSVSVTTVYLFFMACFEVAFTFQRKTLKVEYRNWTIYRTKTFLTFVIFGNFGRNWRFSQSTRGYSNSRAFSLYCQARNVSFVFPSSVSFSSLIRWCSRAAMLWRRNWRNIESTNLINSDNWEVYQVGIGRADRGRWFGLERQRFANLSTVLRTFRPAIETKTRLTFQRSCTPTPVKGLCF